MSNIFDGHEDKTPEELALELGISDLSAVENAGKAIRENIENIWASDFNFEDLESGMEVQDDSISILGNIFSINKESLTIDVRRNDDDSYRYTFEEFKKDAKVKGINTTKKNTNTLESEGKWVDIRDIEKLETGMQIKNSNNVGKIISINKKGFKIKRDDEDNSTSNITGVIPPNCLYIFLANESKYCNQTEWAKKYLFSTLEEGIKVKNTGESGHIRTINNKDNIVIRWEDGSESNYNFLEFLINHLEINITIKISSIKDIKKGMSLQRGSRDRSYIVNGFFEAKGINYITVKDPLTKQTNFFPWNKFISEWKVIRPIKHFFEKIDPKNLGDLNKWTNEFDISKLKPGMNISTSKNGPGHIKSNLVDLFTVDHYNGQKELYSENTINQLATVYKKDLEEPWTDDFEIRNLGKGMEIIYLKDEIGIIDSIGREDVIIKMGNGEKHTFSYQDFETAFSVNKFDLYG